MAAVGEVRGILVFPMNVLSPEHPGTDREIYESQGLLFNLLPVRCRSVPRLFKTHAAPLLYQKDEVNHRVHEPKSKAGA